MKHMRTCRLLSQTTLRNILGTKNLHEILSDRDSISGSMQVQCVGQCSAHCRHSHQELFQAALDEATEPWGIKVERVEM